MASSDFYFKKSLLATVTASLWIIPHSLSFAQSSYPPLYLAESPATVQNTAPAPNVIISLDDSGSMESTDTGSGGLSRIALLKQSLLNVFGGDNPVVKDGEIRLAWQLMCGSYPDCYYGPLVGKNVIVPGAVNSMRVLDATHRANFINFINNDLWATGNTNSHAMMRQADEYMRTPKGVNSPWAAVPGQTEEPYLGCRRAYHIFLTDGAWNDWFDVNADLAINHYSRMSHTAPDGITYDPDSLQTRVFRSATKYQWNNPGVWSGTRRLTYLADWALKSWIEDLQPNIINDIKPSAEYLNASATETVTYSGSSLALQKYWNPKYDPATWQHLVTYTIGYGSTAARGWDDIGLASPTDKLPYGYDGDYPALVTSAKVWPEFAEVPTLDMWSSAINGRGRFYAVQNPQDLTEAFKSIIEKIITTNASSVSTLGISGGSIVNNATGVFSASYDASKAWSGAVSAETYKPDGTIETPAGWKAGGVPVTTAGRLDALTNEQVISNQRLIVTTNSGTDQGTLFKCGELSAEQRTLLKCDNDDDLLNYLRGDRSKEQPTGTFRKRQSRQGDIIRSEPRYVGAPYHLYSYSGYRDFVMAHRNRMPMVYAGGNDGMLHGFDANTGNEKIAYIPKGVYDRLPALANPEFIHKAFVDNTAFTGDVNVAGPGATTPDWRTVLVGTLGAGGRGYFVLDITDPANFTPGNADRLVLVDRTQYARDRTDMYTRDSNNQPTYSTDVADDMGHIFAEPVMDTSDETRSAQIVQMNNGRWATVMGNGYNSKNGRPVLLIQYLDGDRALKTVVANADGTWNGGEGLSAPRLVDINGDGMVDVAYAGDLMGAIWRFDLTSARESDWKTVGWRNNPNAPFVQPMIDEGLFDYSHGWGVTSGSWGIGSTIIHTWYGLPVTTAPLVKVHAQGDIKGVMVAWGTGRDLTERDRHGGACLSAPAGASTCNVNDQFPSSAMRHAFYAVLDGTTYKYNDDATDTDNYKKKLVRVYNSAYDPWHYVVRSSGELDEVTIDTGSVTRDGRIYERTNTSQGTVTSHGPSGDSWIGWTFELPEGEQVLKNPRFYDGSNLIQIVSTVPAQSQISASANGAVTTTGESCSGATVTDAKQFLTLLDIRSGKPPSLMLFDTNGDNAYTVADGMYNRLSLQSGATLGLDQSAKTHILRSWSPAGDTVQEDILRRMPFVPVRANWLHLE
jgi:type IV pilus assembly protein PilY1